jgi:phosphatidylglycerol lysyltransferase
VGLVRPALALALFGAALWALHRALAGYHPRELAGALSGLPGRTVAAALGLTALNYFVLTGYDTLAFRYVGHSLPYRRVALASFVGYAVANNAGSLSLLAGGGVRYRFYAAWGLSAADIARIVGFCTVTFWLGFLALAGFAFVLEPVSLPVALRVPLGSLHLLGIVLLAVLAGYLLWSGTRKGSVRIRTWQVEVPPFALSLAQVALSAADWALASTVLYVLLPAGSRPPFFLFLGLFLLAQILGLGSTVPGGLGVFEGAMVLLLAPFLPATALLGPLLAFRGIYYLTPLAAAAAALGVHEAFLRREAVGRAARLVRTAAEPLSRVVPQVLALGALAAGAVLLLSGATPADAARMGWLRRFVPLPVVEVSHLLGSVSGAALLVVARALHRRVDAAYFLAVVLLVLGAAASLLKGLDYEEALLLGVLLGALLPCRRRFYRRAALTAEILTPRWAAAVGLVFFASVWVGLVAHRHVEYSHELWWRFATAGDAPRFLRASLAAGALLIVLAGARLLSPARVPGPRPGPRELELAAAVAGRSARTDGYLALLGDKSLLFSAAEDAFVMYGVWGRSWIAMGDPVGPAARTEELLWAFRELADRHDGRCVFYEVGREHLPLYLDLGLAPLKLGEQARVPLESFSLEGSARKGLRAARNRVEREGCTFEVVPAEAVPGLMPDLRAVSDAWLAHKGGREKGFSLGFFREGYLVRFPCALVRQGPRLTAFANLWPGGGGEELSVDLMRFMPDAPHGTMDYLFAELLLWGRTRGYRWFNLGMAPFSALPDRALAPVWARLGTFLFRHGEHFYNFQGLRAYKEKFDPVWEPRYLAAPGGLALPRILLDVAALIRGPANRDDR